MRCPQCGELMNRTDYARMEIQKCPSCRGTYVDEGVFHTIQRRREARVTGPDVPKMRPGEEQPVRCPRCNLEMLKIPYTEGSDITVDKCQSCQGYWFDVGELEAVQVVYRNTQDKLKRDKERDRALARAKAAGKKRSLVRWSFVAAVVGVLLVLACWGLVD
jgi:Zn-finger nucleic acid-binding protein